MKIQILIFSLLFCFCVRAQTYDKDWAALNSKLEAKTDVPIAEMEAFLTRYQDKLSVYPDNTMQLYSSVAIGYYNKSEITKAEQNYLSAYEFSKKASDTLLKSVAEYYLASFYHEQNNLTEAEKYYIACMRGMSVVYGQSSREYTAIFFNYTALLVSLEKYTQAQPYVDALLYYYKTLDGVKNTRYINLLNYQAIIFQSQGDYSKATEILSPIVEEKALLALADTANFIIMQSNLGDMYREWGKYDLAIMHLKKAKQNFYEYKVKNKQPLISIENNLGLCYKAINQVKQAEDCYNNAEALYKELNETSTEDYCTLLSNKADLYRELGRWGEASELLLTALQIRREKIGTETTNYANALSNLANVYFDAGYFNEALEKNLEANGIYKRVVGEWHQAYGNSMNSLSLCYLHFGDYKKAEECKTKALEIIERSVGKNHYRYASYLISTCGLYRKTGQYQKAEVNLKEALSLVSKNFGAKHELYALAQFQLAEIYCLTSRFEEATPYYYQSLDYYSHQINNYFDAMSEENQLSYFRFLEPVFESYNLYLLNYKIAHPEKDLSEQISRALQYRLQIKALLTSRSANVAREVFHSGDKQLIEMFNDWMSMKNQLINNFKSAEPVAENNELAKKASILETALKSRLKGFSTSSDINFHSIQRVLNDNECAVEIFKVSEWLNDTAEKIKYGAFIITKKSVVPDLVIFGDGNSMDGAAFARYSNAIDEQINDTLSYPIYFNALEKSLKGISKIYLSSDGVFQKINLLGIYNPATKKYVAQEFDLLQTSKLGSIINSNRDTENQALTADLFGYPDYDYDFRKHKNLGSKSAQTVAKRFGLTNLAKLPGTKTEVEEINKALTASKWKATTYMDEFASEENLRNVKSPKVLHIATHGFYLKDIQTSDKTFLGFESNTFKNNSMLRSGLILAGAGPSTADSVHVNSQNDGIVTAYEASMLNLSNTDLVVLSACQTGLGDEMGSQGVAGLQRSLTIAGAKNIIMSLWPVDDEATKTMMAGFYTNYAINHNVEKSFIAARSLVKQKFPHPYYWAAFVHLKTFN